MASRRPSNESSPPPARGLLGNNMISRNLSLSLFRLVALAPCLSLLVLSLAGCQTQWSILADRDAVLFEQVGQDDGIGYRERESIKANQEFLLSKASLKPDIALVLVAGDQLVSIRRRAEDPREVRITASDWLPMEENDRKVLLYKLETGMSPEEVMSFWGSPDESSEIVIPAMSRKTWVYHTATHTECLFFENQALKSWSSTAAAQKEEEDGSADE